jgi:hypothetical protein
MTEQRELTDDALQVLNWHRHRAGEPPCDKNTRSVVTDEEWAVMKPAEREALWKKYPRKERP